MVVGVLAVMGLAVSGMVVAPPQADALPVRYVGGWIPYWSTDTGTSSLVTNADIFADVSPFWHSLTSDTTVSDQATADARTRTISAARSVGVPVIPAVTDGTGKGQLAAALSDPARRTTVVQTLAALVRTRGYDGLDLDLEGFAYTDGKETWATTRPNWVAFVAELGAVLHAEGKRLYATIPPTYDSLRSPTSGYWVYDYAGIAPHVDRVRIMAYDYSVSSPGPIAPYEWVDDILAYAVTQVPRSKLAIGIPTYGRDWVTGVVGVCPPGTSVARRSLTASAAWQLAAQKNVPVTWDAAVQERTFQYTEQAADATTSCAITRKVYFSDASAVAARAGLADLYQIAGIALWSLGGEDQAQWPALRALTVIDPGWVRLPAQAYDVAFARITGGWEMFHIGNNNAVYRRSYQDGVATAWTKISGVKAKRIAATTSSDGRAELFHIGMDDAIYHNWERTPGGDISSVERFDGTKATAIAAARSGSTWELYHVGTGGLIWRYNGTERLWRSLPDTWASELAATTSDDGRVELFHIGRDMQTWHAWQTAPGSSFTGPTGPGSWQPMGDRSTALTAADGINGVYELYTIGTGGSIWRFAPGSWRFGWQRVSGTGTRLAATNSPDGRVEILHLNSAGELYHAWQKQPGSF